jgi:3-oxoadipate enol-lactonase
MPSTTLNGTRYAYTDEGSGPLVLFGHGLLATKEMFRAQIDALKDRYRCVSVDWPGHGESGYREEGWTFYDMVDDTVALLAELGEERAIFVGLSQGGMVFMRLALRHPELVDRLVLLDTSAGPENPETLPMYEQMREGFHAGDDAMRRQLAETVTTILYGEPWRAANPDGVEHEIALMLAHDPEGQYRADRAVFDRDDVLDQVHRIGAPTLVLVGELDVATPPERAHELADAIPNSRLIAIPDAGHHSAIENPEPVTRAIEEFLEATA